MSEKNRKARVPPPPGNHMRNVEVNINGKIVKMSAKQKFFCEAYAACNNAKQAAIEAGYAKKSAAMVDCENLTKPYLREYVDYMQQKTTTKHILSAIERKEILTQMALDENLSPKDRRAAIDVLNKMTGEYATKVEVGGEFKVNEEVKQETKVTVSNPYEGLTKEDLLKLAKMQ